MKQKTSNKSTLSVFDFVSLTLQKCGFILLCTLFFTQVLAQKISEKPLRLGVVGLSHGHVAEVISRLDKGIFEIVGVAERNSLLWNIDALQKKVNNQLFYTDFQKMLIETRPEAVIVYESIADHVNVVEACAPLGIHVMLEKPLASTLQQARRIAELARKHNILVLTNYETSWYSSNHYAYKLLKEDAYVGSISRINVYDGHGGPIEINCSPQFTDWLTDPIKNGGGAVIDFGCYGANLSTWLMDGQKPLSVFALLKQQKPDVYSKVDDDATIILSYPKVTTSIMASWNWPIGRKDMHIYGNKGYIYQDTPTDLRLFSNNKESKFVASKLTAPYNDPFIYFKAAVRGTITVKSTDLASLENNMIVMEILDAAIRSAQTQSVIHLSSSDTVKWDQQFRNYFYDQRRSFFETMPDTPNEVIMLGNSLTNCAQWDELLPGINCINRGISGDITLGVLDRMDEVLSSKPKSICILIGINDIAKHIPLPISIKNYSDILDKIKRDSPLTKVYVQSLLPINDNFKLFPTHKGISTQIIAFNKALQHLASSKQVTYVDLYTHFIEQGTNQMRSELTNDGLHLLGAGYEQWIKVLSDVLNLKK